MPLSTKIRSAREKLGLTQAQLAKISRVSQPTISEIESGKTSEIKGQILMRLSEALNIDVASLMSEDEELSAARLPFHEEESILKLYRRLTPDRQLLWKEIGQTILDLQPSVAVARVK
jgi:transcriptional regulator with XRE-family HTH domain